MSTFSRYMNLLQREIVQMSQQMGEEMVGFVAVMVIAIGWICLRGHVSPR